MSVNPKVSLAKLVLTHDESIDTPLSITNQNGIFYYHRDHQGSIVALTDSAGTVVESFTYDKHYGTIINHTKTTETNNPYAYTGREFDTDELYYYRARYYDSTVQRFLGEDSIGFLSGDTNWYLYGLNSPISFTDPSGHNPIQAAVIAAMIIRAAIKKAIKLGRKIHCEAPFHRANHPFGKFRLKIKVGVDKCGNPRYKRKNVPCFKKHVHIRCWYDKKGGVDPFLDIAIPYGNCSKKGF